MPQIERLDRAADEEGAFRAGLRSLERRAHGAAANWQRKLERKGHPAEAVGCGDRSASNSLGLIDDQAFARQYVAVRGARGRGPARLRHDLRALGIDA